MPAKTLTKEQFDDVREIFDRFATYPSESKLMLSLTFMGLRAKEVAGLQLVDVTNAAGSIQQYLYVSARNSKGGRPRFVPMPEFVRSDLALFLNETGWAQGPLFWNQYGKPMTSGAVQKRLADAYRLAGLQGCSSHSGRRTFLTRMARNAPHHKATLQDVKNLAGHASIATTECYIDPADNVGALVESIWDDFTPNSVSNEARQSNPKLSTRRISARGRIRR